MRKLLGPVVKQNRSLTELKELAFGPHTESDNYLLYLQFQDKAGQTEAMNLLFKEMEEAMKALKIICTGIFAVQNVLLGYEPKINLIISGFDVASFKTNFSRKTVFLFLQFYNIRILHNFNELLCLK